LQASGFGPSGLACPRPQFSNPLRAKILATALSDNTVVTMFLYLQQRKFMPSITWLQFNANP